MLLNAVGFMGMMRTFRVAWISGRFGGGKTALAFRIAHELLRKGDARYLLSNTRSVWNDRLEDVEFREDKFADAVVLMDEGGLFMKYGRDAEEFMLGLRKLNVYLIIPSVLPPSNRVRFLTIQRVFNFSVLGLPMWLYEYNLNYGAQSEKDFFAWWNYSEIFGVYDTLDYPTSDRGIGKGLRRWVNDRASTDDEGMLGSGGFREVEDSGRDFDPIAEAAETIEGAISLYSRKIQQPRRRF